MNDKPKNGSPGATKLPWHNGLSRPRLIDVADQLTAQLEKAQKALVEQKNRADRFANLVATLTLNGKDYAEVFVPFEEIQRINKRHLEIEAERTSPKLVRVEVKLLAEVEAGKVDASKS